MFIVLAHISLQSNVIINIGYFNVHTKCTFFLIKYIILPSAYIDR